MMCFPVSSLIASVVPGSTVLLITKRSASLSRIAFITSLGSHGVPFSPAILGVSTHTNAASYLFLRRWFNSERFLSTVSISSPWPSSSRNRLCPTTPYPIIKTLYSFIPDYLRTFAFD